MKTKAQVIRDNAQHKALINAVINRIELDSVEDVNNHGISGGYGGFVYYADTHAFAMRYRKQILALAKEMVDAIGYKNIHEMVMSFRCINGDEEDYTDLCKYVGGGRCEQSSITNAMAWFAAEEVCRMFED